MHRKHEAPLPFFQGRTSLCSTRIRSTCHTLTILLRSPFLLSLFCAAPPSAPLLTPLPLENGECAGSVFPSRSRSSSACSSNCFWLILLFFHFCAEDCTPFLQIARFRSEGAWRELRSSIPQIFKNCRNARRCSSTLANPFSASACWWLFWTPPFGPKFVFEWYCQAAGAPTR